MRQGGDPRLPLELALVKVTRPGADLSRESLAYRLEQLEQGSPRRAAAAPRRPRGARPPRRAAPEPPDAAVARARAAAGGVAADDRSPRSRSGRSRRRRCSARRIRPALDDDTLTLEFPASAAFHRQLAEEPKNATLLADALYEVTGRKLALAFAVGERGAGARAAADDEPPGEERDLSNW